MRPLRVVQTPAAASVAFLYTGSPGAGAITLLTNIVDAGVGGRIIVLGSGGNDSAGHFTLTGLDQNGNAQTENVTGGNIASTVSVNYYSVLTSVVFSGTVASTLVIGTRNTTLSAESPMQILDFYNRVPPMVSVAVTGTINWSVVQTFDPIMHTITPSAAIQYAPTATNLTAQTANKFGLLDIGATGCALIINSYSTGATATMNIITPQNNSPT